MIEFINLNEGLYYLGLVQKKKLEPWETSEEGKELLEPGDNYQRVNFFAGSFDNRGYLGGAGSSEKVTWVKIFLSKRARNYMFIDFVEDPGEFTILGQGPSVLNFNLRQIMEQEICTLIYTFQENFDTEDLTTVFFLGKLVRYGYRVLGNGFAVFIFKNYTEEEILLKVDIVNKKNVNISKN